MITIGVVGGIASGKSRVAHFFEQLGGIRLDVDQLGHDVLRDPEVKGLLSGRWGPLVLTQDGEIDRRAVGAKVFGSAPDAAAELAFLEQISHPRIEAKIVESIAQYHRADAERTSQELSALILDAAVMVKAGWYRHCDHVVFVEASEDLRRKRAAARGWTAEEFAAREASQIPLDQKRCLADSIIDNSGTLQETFQQVQILWDRLTSPSKQGLSTDAERRDARVDAATPTQGGS